MNRLNLNALRVFAVVARHGNLQRAADELCISRGAVSQRIKRLELDLGVVLLERGAGGVSVTAAGARCKAAVDAALGTLETALVDIKDAAGTDQVTLHLGASTATKWLMPRIGAFDARFPKVGLRTEVHDQVLCRSLGRNEIAIWPGAAPDPNPAHHTRHLTSIRLVAVCSSDLLHADAPVDLDTLLRMPLLQDAHRRWEQLMENAGHATQRKVLNFDRAALAIDAAIGGHGVALVPSYMVEVDVSAGRLVEIWAHPEPPATHLYVSWSREHMGQRHLGRVVDWIVAEFELGAP
ncbi:LysR family transcriptional regulator [Tateyamaria sp. syn59]|uniref:LysR family transcriptional regulator n=1 Tax=Tateyamaria sp. syn59 TaxID=2576942 RepID=UPI0011BE109F|nr:LysR substrate-binding domain-containing protein [Tateyamaria sp. syn59]